MRSPVRVLATLVLLASAAQAHFTTGQLWVVDQTNNTVYFVRTSDWWVNPIIDSSNGVDGPASISFHNYSPVDGADMVLINANSDEVIEIYECNGGTSLCTRVVVDSSDGLSGPGGPNGIALDGRNHIYIANRGKAEILRFDEDWTNPLVFADASDGIVDPSGMAFLADGDMVVANAGSGGEILRIDRNGTVSLFDVISAEDPYAIALRANSDLYVACNSGAVYRYPRSDPVRRRLLGTYGGANPGIAFDLDGSIMYHVNRGDGKLRTIRPATGVATVRVDRGWDAVSVQAIESQWPPGSFVPYGRATEGEGDLHPTLAGSGDLRPGQGITVHIRDFVGGAPSFFLFGAGRGGSDVRGFQLSVDLTQPWWMWPMVLPGTPGVAGEGDLDLPFTVPNDPALALNSVYGQHLAMDPAAPQGVSTTPGLRFYFGQ